MKANQAKNRSPEEDKMNSKRETERIFEYKGNVTGYSAGTFMKISQLSKIS